jgi:hypothetical protein
MVLSLISATRRRKLVEAAARSRAERLLLWAAGASVLLYNAVGTLDILSTHAAVSRGVAEEANPLLRAAMTHLGPNWVGAKLFLQLVISGMVLWFPHRVVLGIFLGAIAFNAGVVWSNFRIAGLL